MKCSKWFDARKFVPAHVGWYETEADSRWGALPIERLFWTGKKWKEGAYVNDFGELVEWRDRFRGLASPAVKG